MYAYQTSLPYRRIGAMHASKSLSAVETEISLRGSLDFNAKSALVALVLNFSKEAVNEQFFAFTVMPKYLYSFTFIFHLCTG